MWVSIISTMLALALLSLVAMAYKTKTTLPNMGFILCQRKKIKLYGHAGGKVLGCPTKNTTGADLAF